MSRRSAPRLSSGSLPLPHLGDCTHDGQPVGALAGRDRVAGRAEPGRGRARSRARRSRRRRDGRRRRRSSAGRCPGAARSTRRRCPSGRRWRTAAASRSPRARPRAPRPGMSARLDAGRAPAASSGIVHHTALVAQRARRQVERLLAEHLAARAAGAGSEVTCGRTSTVPKRQPQPGPRPARARARRRCRTSLTDARVRRPARVAARRPGATASSRSSSVDDVRLRPGARRRRRCARCECAAASSTVPSTPAGAGLDDAHRLAAAPRSVGVVAGPVRGGSRTSRAAGGAAARGRRARRAAPACRGPKIGEVVLGQRQLGGRRRQVRGEHVGLSGSSTVASTGRAEERLGVVHEVGVERVVARRRARASDVAAPARPARPACCHSDGARARPAGEQHGVEAARRRCPSSSALVAASPSSSPGAQGALERAPLLGQVAAAVGRDPAGQRRVDLGAAARVAIARHDLDAAPRPRRTPRVCTPSTHAGRPAGRRSRRWR